MGPHGGGPLAVAAGHREDPDVTKYPFARPQLHDPECVVEAASHHATPSRLRSCVGNVVPDDGEGGCGSCPLIRYAYPEGRVGWTGHTIDLFEVPSSCSSHLDALEDGVFEHFWKGSCRTLFWARYRRTLDPNTAHIGLGDTERGGHGHDVLPIDPCYGASMGQVMTDDRQGDLSFHDRATGRVRKKLTGGANEWALGRSLKGGNSSTESTTPEQESFRSREVLSHLHSPVQEIVDRLDAEKTPCVHSGSTLPAVSPDLRSDAGHFVRLVTQSPNVSPMCGVEGP